MEFARRGAGRRSGDGAGGRQPLRRARAGRRRREAVRRCRVDHDRTALDRHRRARSRPRRRHRPRVDGAARRRAGHRQVHPSVTGGRQRRARHRPGPLQLWRRVRAPGEVARRAAGRRPSAVVPAGRDVPRADPRRGEPPAARAGHRRFDSDDLLDADAIGARQRRPGARGGDAAAVCREEPEHPDVRRRPHHEGRRAGRAEVARARRRHRALLRRRAPPFASRGPGGEEPLRRGERAWRVRDDR